jgi:hypothetical protein
MDIVPGNPLRPNGRFLFRVGLRQKDDGKQRCHAKSQPNYCMKSLHEVTPFSLGTIESAVFTWLRPCQGQFRVSIHL